MTPDDLLFLRLRSAHGGILPDHRGPDAATVAAWAAQYPEVDRLWMAWCKAAERLELPIEGRPRPFLALDADGAPASRGGPVEGAPGAVVRPFWTCWADLGWSGAEEVGALLHVMPGDPAVPWGALAQHMNGACLALMSSPAPRAVRWLVVRHGGEGPKVREVRIGLGDFLPWRSAALTSIRISRGAPGAAAPDVEIVCDRCRVAWAEGPAWTPGASGWLHGCAAEPGRGVRK